MWKPTVHELSFPLEIRPISGEAGPGAMLVGAQGVPIAEETGPLDMDEAFRRLNARRAALLHGLEHLGEVLPHAEPPGAPPEASRRWRGSGWVLRPEAVGVWLTALLVLLVLLAVLGVDSALVYLAAAAVLVAASAAVVQRSLRQAPAAPSLTGVTTIDVWIDDLPASAGRPVLCLVTLKGRRHLCHAVRFDDSRGRPARYLVVPSAQVEESPSVAERLAAEAARVAREIEARRLEREQAISAEERIRELEKGYRSVDG